ncbi:major head protein [Escherichia coli]|uniref:Major head protein n=1 Tax=Escherichia coli TaxID=562 RepID=A0A376L602_ECOLX|nr:major head protein [Escherichia coli]
MGLFTTRQLLGYTEQKVKFRALFLELFFRRTVNFHTEEVMLDKITEKTPVAAYVSPIVEEKCFAIAVVKPACYVRATSSPNTNLITSRRLSAFLVKIRLS